MAVVTVESDRASSDETYVEFSQPAAVMLMPSPGLGGPSPAKSYAEGTHLGGSSLAGSPASDASRRAFPFGESGSLAEPHGDTGPGLGMGGLARGAPPLAAHIVLPGPAGGPMTPSPEGWAPSGEAGSAVGGTSATRPGGALPRPAVLLGLAHGGTTPRDSGTQKMCPCSHSAICSSGRSSPTFAAALEAPAQLLWPGTITEMAAPGQEPDGTGHLSDSDGERVLVGVPTPPPSSIRATPWACVHSSVPWTAAFGMAFIPALSLQ